MSKTGDLLDVTTVARNFPELPSNVLQRENLLETLDSILSGNTGVVVLEGAEGSGKTTLVANFCRRHARNTIAIFIRGASKVSYSPSYVKLVIAEQITEILDDSYDPT